MKYYCNFVTSTRDLEDCGLLTDAEKAEARRLLRDKEEFTLTKNIGDDNNRHRVGGSKAAPWVETEHLDEERKIKCNLSYFPFCFCFYLYRLCAADYERFKVTNHSIMVQQRSGVFCRSKRIKQV